MTVLREIVVQHSRDRTARIVKRQHASGHKDYVVERRQEGAWVCSKNGPWDFLSNARGELRGVI